MLASSANPSPQDTASKTALQRIPGETRGRTNIDWLKSWHSFSFGDYHDRSRMGFGALRVINDDIVEGGGGFPYHPHRDMEIVTIVLSGELAHKDSLGNGASIKPGDVQRMSAGSGITHSEFNASEYEAVHLMQIWIMPKVRGGEPAYAEKHFDESEYTNRLRLMASPDGRDGSISIQQDLDLYRGHMKEGVAVTWENKPNHALYLHVATGAVTINGISYKAGDAATLLDTTTLDIKATSDSDVLLFDQQFEN